MSLPPRTIRIVLLTTSLLLLGGAVAVVGWGLTTPLGLTEQELVALQANDQALHPTPPATPISEKPTELAAVTFPQLRKPLYDPPPPPPPPPVAKPPLPPLEVQLLGTIIEAQNSLAMISVAGQPVAFKKVGAILSESPVEVRLVEILPSRIVVERDGEKITVSQAEKLP